MFFSSSNRAVMEPLERRSLFTGLPTNFRETLITTELNQSSSMEVAPDGRIFVTEQTGGVRIIQDGVLLPKSFKRFDVDSLGERGLLGIAFDPQFASNHYVYLYMTVDSPVAHNTIVRVTDDPTTNQAVVGSEITIFDLDPLVTATNHNGGGLHFGADGKLYVGVGENARPQLAQSLTSVLGKVLRINSDGSIPTDNPFYDETSGNNRAIYALGLRNPFTFGFQPGSGRLLINDVGQNTWEEVNDGIAGANYGWPTTEGATTDPRFTTPIYAYPHDVPGVGTAITGGVFYQPTGGQFDFPAEYTGNWLFGDFGSEYIKALDPATGIARPFLTDVGLPVDIDEAADGSVLVLSLTGTIHKIDYTASLAPTISDDPSAVTVAVGEGATFSVTAGGDDLTYQWQRDGVDITDATSSSYTLPGTIATDTGASFTVRVTNSFGSVTSSAVALTVVAAQRPTPTILSPKVGAFYRGGITLGFRAKATDVIDKTLKPAAFVWAIEYHHGSQVDAAISLAPGKRSGSFKIPRGSGTEIDVFYRLSLTVTNSSGLATTVSRDVQPRIVSFTVNSFVTGVRGAVAGLGVKLNGELMTSPFTFSAVAGSVQSLEAVSPQDANGQTYIARQWSNGHRPAFNFIAPASTRVFKARFKVV